VANQSFLDAAKVPLGGRLSATVEGRRVEFTVVGAAISPEFVYAPSPGSSMPDDAHQAVFWMPRRALEHAAGMTGVFSSAALKLAPGAQESEAIRRTDEALARYGGGGAFGREDQPSHAFLEAELDELQTSASILPPIFLLVAAVLVHLVVSRLVDAEREQIGLLKAFGFRDAEASRPYLAFALAVGVLGVAGGGLLGLALGASIVRLYTRYFRLPDLTAQFNWTAFAAAAFVAVAACALASVISVRRAAALSPAVAMRPPQPTPFHRGWLDWLGAPRLLDQPTLMIVRRLQRYPARSALTVAGMAASLSLLVGTQFLFDSLDHVIAHAYYRAQRWSEEIGLVEARPVSAAVAAARLPGVAYAEPVRTATIRVSAGGRSETVAVRGLESTAALARALDVDGRPIRLFDGAAVLSAALAARLDVRPGDPVWLESMDGRKLSARPVVIATAEDFSGLAVYLPRRYLNRILREGDLANGVQLLVAADRRPAFYAAVEEAPQVVFASSRDETVRNWREAMTEAFRTTITFYVGFAAAIAFGVAYNTGRITFAERARDLATLRVLGFRRAECAYILAGELSALGVATIPLGFLGGASLAKGLVAAYSRNELRLPSTVTADSYGVALAAFLAAILLAMALVGRRIWSLDLVAVLKTRE
jgi:putative ABC transport system permease protein